MAWEDLASEIAEEMGSYESFGAHEALVTLAQWAEAQPKPAPKKKLAKGQVAPYTNAGMNFKFPTVVPLWKAHKTREFDPEMRRRGNIILSPKMRKLEERRNKRRYNPCLSSSSTKPQTSQETSCQVLRAKYATDAQSARGLLTMHRESARARSRPKQS